LAASLALVACAASENKQMTGSAGTSGAGTAGMGAAGSVASGSAGSGPGTAGTGAGTAGDGSGTGGGAAGAAAGSSGGAGSGAAGSPTGTAGSGTDGGAGSGNKDASTTIVDGAPVTTAGCANHSYPLCLDFESPVDTTIWSGGNMKAIETTEVAHGTHAYHLFSDADTAGAMSKGVFTTSKLGTLKDQIWGRFYIHFSPGAPGGHGNLIAASDGVWANGNYNGNWYEIGWQFDGIMGVFHTTSGERPLRSMPYLVDQWYCVELFFDGTTLGSARWWIDGAEAKYYTPMAGVCCAATNPTTPASVLIPQFKSITVGWTPYAGLGLMLPDQTKIVDTRMLKDAWIDDVAFDTQRIGCIQ
jgi:hypothetical protein